MWVSTLTLILGTLTINALPTDLPQNLSNSSSQVDHAARSHLSRRAVAATSWAHLGCVSDAPAHLLTKAIYDGTLNSRDYCVNQCASNGFKYAGVQNFKQCWCSNTLGTSGGAGKLLPLSTCSSDCPGKSSEKCGGTWAMNLFAAPSALVSEGCYQDAFSPRALPFAAQRLSYTTPTLCMNHCAGRGYAYAGVEYGTECWCGNSRPTKRIPDSMCSMPCGGDKTKQCGAGLIFNLYPLGGVAPPPLNPQSSSTAPVSQPTTTTATTTAKSTTATPTSTTGVTPISSNAGNSAVHGTTNGPGSGSTKWLWAHFMVGNTYTYNRNSWTTQMNTAKSAGIDGFALNMGRDSWEPARVSDAYAVAQSVGFKLFFSLDMTSLGCGSSSDAVYLTNLVKTYANHPAQARYDNKVLVSTFSGEYCSFGQGSAQNGWNYFRSLLSQGGVSMYFIPAQFSDVSTFQSSNWFDGIFAWNSGWPMNNQAISTSEDNRYIGALGNKGYMAAVSPFFFTYYGPHSWNKNWIYRSDDWLLATRFDQIVASRNRFDMVQIISWNDFGESSYIGELAVATDQPMSTGWTNGMPHTGLLSLIRLYAQAFKTGSFPGLYTDKIWLWIRPHPRGANPSNPTNPRPNHWDWTYDNLYVIVTLMIPSTVKIESGSNFATWNLPAGLTKLAVASAPGPVKVSIMRNSATVRSYDSGSTFTYTNNPKDYNYNYFVAEA